jgi:hypothetical protein
MEKELQIATANEAHLNRAEIELVYRFESSGPAI